MTSPGSTLAPGVTDYAGSAAEWHRWLYGPRVTPVPARVFAADLQRKIPSEHISLDVDATGLLPHAAQALSRAVDAAIEAWNCSLTGVAVLSRWPDGARADVRVTGTPRPLYGSALGVTRHTPLVHGARNYPATAEIIAGCSERDVVGSPCMPPIVLFGTICHELGHLFWLGEAGSGEEVMGVGEWTRQPPSPPFLRERRAVISWVQAAERIRLAACRSCGLDAAAALVEERLGRLSRALEAGVPVTPRPAYRRLMDHSYAPPEIRDYWNANLDVQRGRLTSAAAGCTRAVERGLKQPEVFLRRGLIRLWLGGAEAIGDLEKAVELDPLWAYSRGTLREALQSGGLTRRAEAEQRAVQRLERLGRLESWLDDVTAWSSGRMIAATTSNIIRLARWCVRMQLARGDRASRARSSIRRR